ncbi:PAS domain S-box protein [Candidatus Methylobacter oryzae]|uniref:histidine kinase n=1 Tax=Candidatus Methylobacter oryzae TaxID=2497749 RepID=A0ABY3C4Q0_9GAMM|nr:PAS domain S-box protein [Candidatus Methylobacter oryzae]TRW89704.1 PAS domain S-box protein [Candidatus Methylobacter oryzae]
MENDIQAALLQMRKGFIAGLPERLNSLKTLVADIESGQHRAQALESLHRAVRRLADSAGVHQLTPIFAAARNLELIVTAVSIDGAPGQHGLQAIRTALANLEAQKVSPGSDFIPQISTRHVDVPRVVIAGDDEEQSERLCSILEKAGYRVDVFHELAAFPAAGATIEPLSAIFVNTMFDAGVQVIAELKKQSLSDFPVIFVSGRADMLAKLEAYRAGATHYLTKPVDSDALLRVMADAVTQTPAEPFRVLLVDNDDEQHTAYGLTLRQAGMTVTATGDPFQVPEILESFAAEVLVLDMLMPECSGPELAIILRDDERYAQIPIVYLAAETHISGQFQALNCSGDHFLSKPVNPRYLVTAIASHARRFRQTQVRKESMRTTLYERERQQQALDVHAIVTVTDKFGTLIYVNDRFCLTSGYSRDELLGRNHRIIKSGEHPPEFYLDMWSTIAGGNIWRGEVCNRRKNGSLYWVETSIVPFLDNTGLPYQYVSIRTEITHIKEAELRLRLLERAVEASTSSISMADATKPDMPLIYVNPAFEHITGYDRDEVLGRNCRLLQGKDVDQPGLNEIRKALREGRAGEARVHNYRKDGTPFWNDLRIAPVHDEQGRLSHFIGISDDVTERRKATNALRKSEERLRLSQHYANIGTWDWNIQTGKIICSERIGSMFGYPDVKRKASFKHFLNGVYPDDRKRVLDAIDACLQQGVEYNIEHRCVWPDGTVRWLLERGDVARDENGVALHMLGVMQDITERKLVEIKSLNQQARLVIFKHIIENVADGVITIDPTGIVRFFNPAAEKLFGYSAPEIVDRNVSLLLPEPYRSEYARYLNLHNGSQPASIIVKKLELSGQHKDGAIFPMELAISLMEIDDDKHFVVILRDISERKQYEQEIIAARDEAERANNAKSEFLSSMSHELRTPMNAILGFGQLLEIDVGLNEDQADYVSEILKAGRHLLELINEVLDLAKIESGNINLSLEPLSCLELITECLTLIGPLAQARGIAINNDVVGDCLVRADRTRLKQVLINLLSNAVKYNRPQGTVLIQADVQDDRIRLKVSDTGYGIPVARWREIFQPFSRLGAEDADIEGTGIGLTISSRLMKMMGGTIGMESEEDQGSTFWIELPKAASEPGIRNNDVEQAIVSEPVSGGEYRHTLLYIEDNPANLRLIEKIFSRHSQFRLLAAATPELGLELVSAYHPNLILLDINLPGMDGYQVLSVLHSLNPVKKIPVIGISANATAHDVERAMAAGFDEYMTKPVDVSQLLESVNRLLSDNAEE